MSDSADASRARLVPAALLLAVLVCPVAQAQPAPSWAGRAVAEVLQAFQATGLRVVFTTELVRDDMRVTREPRATRPREVLDEILAPHGLHIVEGPARMLVVARRPASRPPARPSDPRRSPTEVTPDVAREDDIPPYVERVLIETSPTLEAGSTPTPDRRLSGDELARVGSTLVSDPARVVQTLPGVVGASDYRSDFSMRGSDPRHSGIIVEGIDASWLRHAVVGDSAGAVTMVGTDAVSEMLLHAGGYARQDGNHIGPQLSLFLHEGQRTGARVAMSASTTGTSAAAEGPLGSRGSWFAAGRRSHAEWPVGRQDHAHTVFGYSDVNAKLVYDVGHAHQVTSVIIAGASQIEREAGGLDVPLDGFTRAALASVALRSTVGADTVVRQQVAWVRQGSDQDTASGGLVGDRRRALTYRADVARPLGGMLLEAGALVRALDSASHGYGAPATTSLHQRAAYTSIRWTPTARLVVAPGVRLAHSSHLSRPVTDAWVEAEWRPASRWQVRGSAALVHQLPTLDLGPAEVAASLLTPRSALDVDLGVSHLLGASARWRTTVFSRSERLDASVPLVEPHRARGVEVVLDRRVRAGLTGWVAYTYARVDRPISALAAWRGALDRRHLVSASASWTPTNQTQVAFTFRSGSPVALEAPVTNDGVTTGWPVPLSVPAYARLDARIEHVVRAGGRVSLFAEVVNVLDRTNVGVAPAATWVVGPPTVSTDRLFPRLMTGGIRVRF